MPNILIGLWSIHTPGLQTRANNLLRTLKVSGNTESSTAGVIHDWALYESVACREGKSPSSKKARCCATGGIELSANRTYPTAVSTRLVLASGASETGGTAVTPWSAATLAAGSNRLTLPIGGDYLAESELGTRYLPLQVKAASRTDRDPAGRLELASSALPKSAISPKKTSSTTPPPALGWSSPVLIISLLALTRASQTVARSGRSPTPKTNT